jgi:hypothetical protein
LSRKFTAFEPRKPEHGGPDYVPFSILGVGWTTEMGFGRWTGLLDWFNLQNDTFTTWVAAD